MIEYSFGENKCKLDWNNFLCVTKNVPNSNIKIYKSTFKDFSEFYEYVDRFKNEITHLLFDGYEYFLEEGVLHNLYGPAIIKYLEKSDYTPAGSKWYSFYINGKLVHDKVGNSDRGCRTIENFENEKIFFHEELSSKKDRKQKDVDYIKTPINLQNLRLLDQRKKKLKQLDGID